MKKIAIHASSNIPWQKRWAPAVKEGLNRHGIESYITTSRKRETDTAIIHGPNLYQPQNRMDKGRLEKYLDPREIEHWSLNSDNYLLCQQHDTGRSTKFNDINKWYRNVQRRVHPNHLRIRRKITLENVGRVEFMRSLREDLSDVKAIFSLNSIVSVEALLLGKGIITDDPTNPCYAVASSEIGSSIQPFDRTEFLTYLAHCQWHIDEVRNGTFFQNMTFGPSGSRLHEIPINI